MSNQFCDNKANLYVKKICDNFQTFKSALVQKNGFIKSTLSQKKKNSKLFYDKKLIFGSNLCQKANFQISSAIKSSFNFLNQICIKKHILMSNLWQKDIFKSNLRPKKKFVKSILWQKADCQVTFMTKSELSNYFCYKNQIHMSNLWQKENIQMGSATKSRFS